MLTFLIHIWTHLLVHYCTSLCLESGCCFFFFAALESKSLSYHSDRVLSSAQSDSAYSNMIWTSFSDSLTLTLIFLLNQNQNTLYNSPRQETAVHYKAMTWYGGDFCSSSSSFKQKGKTVKWIKWIKDLRYTHSQISCKWFEHTSRNALMQHFCTCTYTNFNALTHAGIHTEDNKYLMSFTCKTY